MYETINNLYSHNKETHTGNYNTLSIGKDSVLFNTYVSPDNTLHGNKNNIFTSYKIYFRK